MKRLSELNRIADEMEMPVATEAIAQGATTTPSGNERSMIWRRPKFMEEKKLSAAEKERLSTPSCKISPLQEVPTEESIRGRCKKCWISKR